MFLFAAGLFTGAAAFAQTNASIFGIVTDENGQALPGATVVAKHEPSGSVFGTTTREDGRYNLPNVRIGGAYTITASYTGFEPKVESNIWLSLGQALRLNFKVKEASKMISEVLITAETNATLNGSKTGAGSNIKGEALTSLPSLSRSLNDFLRLTPQGRSSSVASTTGSAISFAGQDSRFNNLTIDGSIFNNSFGLAGSPAGQTASTPISLDAIDEIQVNLAPYDVRLGGFTGAGVNAVTKSGDNTEHGTAFFNRRNQNMTGKKAGDVKIVRNDFEVNQFGVSLGGPIRQYEVHPDLAKLRDYKLTIGQLFNALQRANANAGGGSVAQGRQQFLIRSLGLLKSSADIGQVVVAEHNGTPVLVRDLAEVVEANLPPVAITCFGEYRIAIDGEVMGLGQLRPQARWVLQILSAAPGRDHHRELLEDILWPGVDHAVACHRLSE